MSQIGQKRTHVGPPKTRDAEALTAVPGVGEIRCRLLGAGSTRVNLVRVCGSLVWTGPMGDVIRDASGRSRIAKTTNLDPMELMGRVLKGDGDDGYG